MLARAAFPLSFVLVDLSLSGSERAPAAVTGALRARGEHACSVVGLAAGTRRQASSQLRVKSLQFCLL